MIDCKIDAKKGAFECKVGHDAVRTGAEAIMLVKSIYRDVYSDDPEMAKVLKKRIMNAAANIKGGIWVFAGKCTEKVGTPALRCYIDSVENTIEYELHIDKDELADVLLRFLTIVYNEAWKDPYTSEVFRVMMYHELAKGRSKIWKVSNKK